MRYSYLEMYVGASLSDIEIRGSFHARVNWIFASDGLKYSVYPGDDDTVRLIDVKIPETHPLFNIGVIIDCAFSTPENLFSRIHLYGGKEFRKVGIPVTLLEAEDYDKE